MRGDGGEGVRCGLRADRDDSDHGIAVVRVRCRAQSGAGGEIETGNLEIAHDCGDFRDHVSCEVLTLLGCGGAGGVHVGGRVLAVTGFDLGAAARRLTSAHDSVHADLRQDRVGGAATLLAVGVEPLRSDLERLGDKGADAADSPAVELALSRLDLIESGGGHRTGADDNPDNGRGCSLRECGAVVGCRIGTDDIGARNEREGGR